jgi:hypothetical protein
MKNFTLLYIIISILFNNCTNIEKKNIQQITRQDFKKNTKLNGKIIDFNKDTLNPSHFHLINDSLIFVERRKANPYYIEIYHLYKNELISKIAKRGRGPHEFLSVRFRNKYCHDNKFYLRDVIKCEFSFYSIDSIMAGKKTPYKRIKAPRYTYDIDQLKNDKYICYNEYYLESNNIKNEVKPLFILNTKNSNDFEIKENLVGKYYTANVSDAYVYSSPVNSNIILINKRRDELKIYNNQLKLKTSIVGPDMIKPQYYVKDDDDHVSTKGDYYGYKIACYTKNAIYAIYNPVEGSGSYRKPLEVFKINWNGELLHRYKLDRYIYTIFVDKNEKYLYGSADPPPKHYPRLIRYKLK